MDAIECINEVAIIGMAGRFPSAKNLEEFWQNLRDSVESITFFSDQELLESGIDPAVLGDPNYVKSGGGILEDIDLFDAAFFGYPPRQTEIMDPQHRLFLECAWEALESAGYNSETYEGRISVYGGVSISSYFLSNLFSNPDLIKSVGSNQIRHSNRPDNLATRVAYKLNLKGSAITVQTGCSTSLVAVHLACQSLLEHECHIALAGGVTINSLEKAGYFYQEGGIASPDGHCRAFDAKAKGTVGGDGVGIVVLKRLEDAITDGDCIHAVIKGSAINNDGSLKVGYTAPSVDGQAKVITEALAVARIDPETVSYVEAHGTGTVLGDPIEIAALTEAFPASTDKKGFCALGSVKTNIGHLDTTAGIAGLIKTVLALKHKQIPPSLHFEEPNPKIDFANSPFYVNAKLSEWQTSGDPRRAGVSSFGIGGTNAHVILEEAPPVEASGPSRAWQLLLLSAKTSTALDAATANLANYLQQYPDANIADVAYTLQVGRRGFEHRRMVICQYSNDAVQALIVPDSQRVLSHYQEPGHRSVVFMFPGQGTQYIYMARELYQTERVFTEQIDCCCEQLKPHLGLDLRQVLYPDGESIKQQALNSEFSLNETIYAQPALFIIEYALAKLWMSWGVQPAAMIGHSIGEFVAACLAGVFSFEDALVIVATRGQLMQQCPPGAMLAVQCSEQQIQPWLGEVLSLAGSNTPSSCVVSGPAEAVEQLQQKLQEQDISCRRLHTSHAFHSEMMEPILEPFIQALREVKLNPPTIPFISNLSGTWITPNEAMDPHYWVQQLRQPVRFSDGLRQVLTKPQQILLEVGPGRTLSTFAKQHQPDELVTLTSVRHPKEQVSDVAFLLNTLGRLWLMDIKVDWSSFYAHEHHHRIPLPTYSFERQRYWIEPQKQADKVDTHQTSLHRKPDIADWFYLPSWRQSISLEPVENRELREQRSCWLVFVDDYRVGAQIAKQLEQAGQDVITVTTGAQFAQLGDCSYAINPQQRDDYDTLIQSLWARDWIPQTIAHFWSVTPSERAQSPNQFLEESQNLGFYSLLFLAQALGEQDLNEPLTLMVVTNSVYNITGDERLCPEKATVLGPCKVIPQEYPNINCCSVDVVIPESGTSQENKIIEQIVAELTAQPSDLVVAYRGNHRWVQTFEAIHLDEDIAGKIRLRERGVYLITGGLGGIGLVLAEYLAKKVQAKLILIGRSGLPDRDQWDQWLTTHDEQDNVSLKLKKVRAIEDLGAEVLTLTTDVADEPQMRTAIAFATERFGEIHGVIHAAGNVEEATCIIQENSKAKGQRQFQPKVYGLFVLEKVLQGRNLDFCLLMSSLASILGGLGYTAYSAANLFMDAFAHKQNQTNSFPWISVNWDGWRVREKEEQEISTVLRSTLAGLAITPKEGVEAFQRILSRRTLTQVVVSTGDLQVRLDQWLKLESLRNAEEHSKKGGSFSLRPRANLSNVYVASRNELEQTVTNVWQQLLGIEQVGIHDNFFELGGDSLISIQVISRLKKELNIQIPVVSIYERPTVSSLAELLSRDKNEINLFKSSHFRGKKRRDKQKKASVVRKKMI